MTRLRVKGFGLALDRFGASRASSDRVARFPFTKVKVDGRLVSGAAGGQQRREVLEETFDAARSLGISVVATGCESDADFDLLVEMDFRYIQGPCIGAAMTATELVEQAGSWSPPGSGDTRP